MVKIRLSGGGAKGRPFYHIVVTVSAIRATAATSSVGFTTRSRPARTCVCSLTPQRSRRGCQGAQLSDKVRWLVKEAGKQVKAA